MYTLSYMSYLCTHHTSIYINNSCIVENNEDHNISAKSNFSSDHLEVSAHATNKLWGFCAPVWIPY